MSSTEIPQLGVGYWRGPGETETITEEPGPGGTKTTTQDGPPLSSLPMPNEAELERRIQAAAYAILSKTLPDEPDGNASFQLDSSGNGVAIIYQVAAGFEFRLTRLLLDAAGFTPAAPYSNAAAWVGVFDLDAGVASGSGPGVEAFVQGGLRDFAPLTAGAPIFPGLLVDTQDEAAIYRGPAAVAVRIVSGPASTRVVAYYRGVLRRTQGIS